MLLPAAIAFSSHVAGALLGLGGRYRSLAALRTCALVSALVPTFSEYIANHREDEAWSLGNTIVNSLAIVLTICAVVGWIAHQTILNSLRGQDAGRRG